MKRYTPIALTVLLVLLCFGLIGCGNTAPSTTTDLTPPEVTHSKVEFEESEYLEPIRQLMDTADPTYQGTITEWNFRNNFSGISTKVHTGESADILARLIGSLKDTDQSVPAICDAPWDNESYFPPEEVEVGTHWYQIGDTLYRETYSRNPNGNNFIPSLARVTSHYGEGIVLETTDEFWRMFNLISTYHPWAYYGGSYADGTLKLIHTYPGEDDLTVTVKDLEMGTKDLELKRGNKITLEITAPTDREVTFQIMSAHSDDLLATVESQSVALKANTPQTVTLTFNGWDEWGYILDISVENTWFEIRFNLS